MFRNKNKESLQRLAYSLAVLVLAGAALLLVAKVNNNEVSASGKTVADAGKQTDEGAIAATFPGTGVGAIPDSSGGPQAPGTPLNISFAVTGISGAPSHVEVSMTGTHSWVGDLVATLIAPNGTSFTIFGYTGATSGTVFGSSTNLGATYNFKDTAAGVNWWTAAVGTATIAAGDYRTTVSGPTTSPAGVTNLTAAFAGVAAPNGTWTLRLTDGAAGDAGSVTAANLTLTGAAVSGDAPMDFNADGRTDYVVVRNTGGGPGGQVTWFYNLNNTANPTVAFAWGLATDHFISEDFDNDNKDDIAVWRPGAATVAAFYIYNSGSNTVRVEAFGQTGDDPTIVDDYNGDGSADLAVYRSGVAAGDPSTWYYRTTPGGAVTFVPWGQNGDFPSPGDYDGNGSADFVIQRNGGGGQAAFWTKLSTGAILPVTMFGTPTDVIVPGDYDGDGKTDIATVRGVGGAIQWHYLASSNSSINYITFGASATDFPTQGDYDGDGRTDAAIWRPSITPGASAFWIRSAATGAASAYPYGANGDYPPANYNTH